MAGLGAAVNRRVPVVLAMVISSYFPDPRRSLAMLSPGAPALNREQAMKIVAQLEDADERLSRLIAELRRLTDEAERR